MTNRLKIQSRARNDRQKYCLDRHGEGFGGNVDLMICRMKKVAPDIRHAHYSLCRIQLDNPGNSRSALWTVRLAGTEYLRLRTSHKAKFHHASAMESREPRGWTYERVAGTDLDVEEKTGRTEAPDGNARLRGSGSRHGWFLAAHVVLLVVWIALLTSNVPSVLKRHCSSAQMPYSPLSGMIEYEPRVFHTGFPSDKTNFQGAPNEENTDAWNTLTEGTSTRGSLAPCGVNQSLQLVSSS